MTEQDRNNNVLDIFNSMFDAIYLTVYARHISCDRYFNGCKSTIIHRSIINKLINSDIFQLEKITKLNYLEKLCLDQLKELQRSVINDRYIQNLNIRFDNFRQIYNIIDNRTNSLSYAQTVLEITRQINSELPNFVQPEFNFEEQYKHTHLYSSDQVYLDWSLIEIDERFKHNNTLYANVLRVLRFKEPTNSTEDIIKYRKKCIEDFDIICNNMNLGLVPDNTTNIGITRFPFSFYLTENFGVDELDISDFGLYETLMDKVVTNNKWLFAHSVDVIRVISNESTASEVDKLFKEDTSNDIEPTTKDDSKTKKDNTDTPDTNIDNTDNTNTDDNVDNTEDPLNPTDNNNLPDSGSPNKIVKVTINGVKLEFGNDGTPSENVYRLMVGIMIERHLRNNPNKLSSDILSSMRNWKNFYLFNVTRKTTSQFLKTIGLHKELIIK